MFWSGPGLGGCLVQGWEVVWSRVGRWSVPGPGLGGGLFQDQDWEVVWSGLIQGWEVVWPGPGLGEVLVWSRPGMEEAEIRNKECGEHLSDGGDTEGFCFTDQTVKLTGFEVTLLKYADAEMLRSTAEAEC